MTLSDHAIVLRLAARPALLVLAALALASCEPAKTTGSTPGTPGGTTDNVAPTVASVALGANRDTIDVNSPLTPPLSITIVPSVVRSYVAPDNGCRMVRMFNGLPAVCA